MIEAERSPAPEASRSEAENLSRPVKRSFSIAGHKTSISLEHSFWLALKDTARIEQMPMAALVAEIDRTRGSSNLSSAIRVWLLERARRGDLPASDRASHEDVGET